MIQAGDKEKGSPMSPAPTRERFAGEYQRKLCKAEEAVASLPRDSMVFFGTGLAEPQLLLWALSNRLRDGDLESLRVFCGPPGYHAGDSLCGPDIASPRLSGGPLVVGRAWCRHARYRIAANGTHQTRSFVRIVIPQPHGRSPRSAAARKPIGPNSLPRNPTRTIGQ